jgi:hypothetical protein
MTPMGNGTAVAAVLGYGSAEALRGANGDYVAFRLAYLLDLPARTPESLMVLRRIVGLVVDEASVPYARRTSELVEETDRIAGSATPLDEDLRTRVAQGFEVAVDAGESVAAVYGICSRATRFLFKAIMIARGDVDEQ